MLEKVPIKFKHATALWEPHDRHKPIEYDEGDIIDYSKKPLATVLSLDSEQAPAIVRY